MMRQKRFPVSNLTQVEGDLAPERLLETLKSHRFTEGLPDPILSKLPALARPVAFQQDEVIFRAGERSPYLYLVLSGSVCVEIRTPFYSVCVEAVGPGEAFGWSSLLDHHDTVFQVRARESSVALCLDAEQLLATCHENPRFGFELFRRLFGVVADRVRATEARLAEFCGYASPVKLKRVTACDPREAP